MTDFTNYPVADLVPQSPPFVLIDRIIAYDDSSLQAEVTIRRDSLFFDPESASVASWVGIEYMAQTIAAFAGIRAKTRQEKVRAGFLLGTRKYTSRKARFLENRSYRIHAVESMADERGLIRFQCRIVDENDVLTNEALISILQLDDLSAFAIDREESFT